MNVHIVMGVKAEISLHVCASYQWRLKQFIIQQIHKNIIRKYN